MSDAQQPLPGLDPDVLERVVTQEVSTHNVEKMLHEGHIREFTLYSDEPPDLWGEDRHPHPLEYILVGVGF